MTKKIRPIPNGEDADLKALRADLQSAEPATRAKAVRSVCPCRLGFEVFEQLLAMALALQKDPDPTVRAAALHVFEDGYQMCGEGLPTSRRMVTDEMLATKIRSRGRNEAREMVTRAVLKSHAKRADRFRP